MRRILSIFILSFCSLYTVRSVAQTDQVDSVYNIWLDASNPDTVRLAAADAVAWALIFTLPDSAVAVSRMEYEYAVKTNHKDYQAEALNTQGIYYWIQSDYDAALAHYERALAVRKEINDKKGIAGAYNNMGLIYSDKGDYDSALKYFEKSLAIKKKVGDQNGVANSLGNIGSVYQNQGHFAKAIEYQLECLMIMEELKDAKGAAGTMNNIAMLYEQQQDYENALTFYKKSKEIYMKTNNKRGLAFNYMGIGGIYKTKKQYELALEYFNKSLDLRIEIGDRKGQATSYSSIGTVYLEMGSPAEALSYFHKSLVIQTELEIDEDLAVTYSNIGRVKILQGKSEEGIIWCQKGLDRAKEVGLMVAERDACDCLYKGYRKLGNKSSALEFYEAYVQLKDSIVNEERTREITRKEFQYKFEKKIAADSIRNAELQKVAEARLQMQQAQIEKSKTVKIALYSGMAMALCFIGFVIYRLRLSQKQNRLIESQKQTVEEQNKEILDSITYAKRLQDAILPSDDSILKSFPLHFVLHKPKDIVAGDFYWLKQMKDYTIFAVADCTGHGVPGAMVSVVCSNVLNEAVNLVHDSDPAAILDHARSLLIAHFENSNDVVRDGMDIALCAIHRDRSHLLFSGANNPLYIVRNQELEEIKGDKQPIGKSVTTSPFHTHKVPLQKDDIVYMFTDGYADQFGGPKGKKLKYKPFKELLTSLSIKDMNEQKQEIDSYLESWMNGFQQIDDICVVGIKI